MQSKNNFPSDLSSVKNWLMTHYTVVFLCIILIIGGSLRFYDFTNLLRFNNDQVRDAKIIHAMISDHEFPLLGPKAGGTTFKLGPAFYYLEYLSACAFGNTPQGLAFFIPIIGTLSILLFYALFKKYFSPPLSLLLTFLYATSFYAVKYARFAWNPNVIPFFLFLFLFVLLKVLSEKDGRKFFWSSTLGIVTGIAMQLHTTLLILLPVFIIACHCAKYIRSRRVFLTDLLCTWTIIFILLSPMVIYDIRNNGENISAFLRGSETKSAKNDSLWKNALLDGQFFIQSTVYALTGTELTKDWTQPKKIIATRNYREAFVAFASTILFTTCLYIFTKDLRSRQRSDKRSSFGYMLLSTIALSFLLFLPIAHELNTRFFIIVIFLPFVLIGAIYEKIYHTKNIPLYVRTFLIIGITCVFFITNMRTYAKAYDLDNTSADRAIYGGISMQEITALLTYMHKNTHSAQKIHLIPHEYDQSLRYIAKQNNILLSSTTADNVPLKEMAYFISTKVDDTTLSKELSTCFSIISTEKIFRFRIFTLEKFTPNCD